VQRRLRDVLAQPVPALRERLRLAVNPADFGLVAVRQQVVVHAHPHLGANANLRHADEHVKRVGDSAVGRVFQGHHAEVDVTAVDLLEDGGDVADRHVLDRLAESVQSGEVAEAVLGPQERDLQDPLQCP